MNSLLENYTIENIAVCDYTSVFNFVLSKTKLLIVLLFVCSLSVLIIRYLYKYNRISAEQYLDYTFKINIAVVGFSAGLFSYYIGF